MGGAISRKKQEGNDDAQPVVPEKPELAQWSPPPVRNRELAMRVITLEVPNPELLVPSLHPIQCWLCVVDVAHSFLFQHSVASYRFFITLGPQMHIHGHCSHA